MGAKVIKLVDRTSYYDFDGVNEYINCGNDSTLNFERTDSFSVSCWVNISALASSQMLSKSLPLGALGHRGWYFGLNGSNNISLFISNQKTNRIVVRTNNTYTTDTWYNIIITYDGSSSASGCHIYVNNTDETLTTTNDTLSATILNSEPFEIGRYASYHNGSIDEVSVWDKELTPSEVTEIYNQGRINTNYSDLSIIFNCVSHWKLGEDDTFSTNWTVIDERKTNHGVSVNMDITNRVVNETLSNFTTFSSENSYFTFDGVNEWVNCGNSSTLNFGKADSFSYSCWMNATSLASAQILLSKRNLAEGTQLYFAPTTSTAFSIFFLDDSGLNRRYLLRGTTTLSTDTWYHIVLTYDGTDATGVKLYINNVSDSLTIIDNNITGDFKSTHQFEIGSARNGQFNFNGIIDEVSVWEKELTSDEVNEIFKRGRLKVDYGDMIGSVDLVSHWRIGDNDTFSTNWTVIDERGVNDGVSNNMDLTNKVTEVVTPKKVLKIV